MQTSHLVRLTVAVIVTFAAAFGALQVGEQVNHLRHLGFDQLIQVRPHQFDVAEDFLQRIGRIQLVCRRPVPRHPNKRKSGGVDVLTVVLANSTKARREVSNMAESSENTWLSRQELADRYGVPVKTPAEGASRGTGPRYAKFGRHVRYRLSDVIDWEREQFPREKRSTA